MHGFDTLPPDERQQLSDEFVDCGRLAAADVVNLPRAPFSLGDRDESLDHISWEDFFDKFDEARLAFLYQEKTSDGKTSRFHKFVDRSEMDRRH